MTSSPQDQIIDNSRWAEAGPSLSVLIPFFGDDPVQLIEELAGQSADLEIILLDDGGKDDQLAERVAAAVLALPAPARFVRLGANVGRAKGRNRLAAEARGRHLLFLDADMLPDSARFCADWQALISSENPAVAFGGFSLLRTPSRPEHDLHRAMALRSDCLSPADRMQSPEKHVFTSNLLVRRDVFDSIAFDEAFAGWGWEDVEWAMRVSRQWQILHPDIPASHLGLDMAAVLSRKYEQSAANFARVVQAHPAIVSGYASHRVARVLKQIPGRSLIRRSARIAALSSAVPVALRAFAMRLYRAGLYAEVI
jgi:glycosyltransferase involved in cell wall biosynthesis